MTGPSRQVRRTVMDRAGRVCEVCGAATAVDLQHRRPRGMGGTSLPWVNRPANLIATCRYDHLRMERYRKWALDRGLLLPYSAEDAWSHPVELWRGKVWLDDAGRYLAAERGAVV